MPRFFFDIHNGEECPLDDEGTELPNLAAARMEATATLVSLAGQYVRSADAFHLTAAVRDEVGQKLIEAKLSLRADYLSK